MFHFADEKKQAILARRFRDFVGEGHETFQWRYGGLPYQIFVTVDNNWKLAGRDTDLASYSDEQFRTHMYAVLFGDVERTPTRKEAKVAASNMKEAGDQGEQLGDVFQRFLNGTANSGDLWFVASKIASWEGYNNIDMSNSFIFGFLRSFDLSPTTNEPVVSRQKRNLPALRETFDHTGD